MTNTIGGQRTASVELYYYTLFLIMFTSSAVLPFNTECSSRAIEFELTQPDHYTAPDYPQREHQFCTTEH